MGKLTSRLVSVFFFFPLCSLTFLKQATHLLHRRPFNNIPVLLTGRILERPVDGIEDLCREMVASPAADEKKTTKEIECLMMWAQRVLLSRVSYCIERQFGTVSLCSAGNKKKRERILVLQRWEKGSLTTRLTGRKVLYRTHRAASATGGNGSPPLFSLHGSRAALLSLFRASAAELPAVLPASIPLLFSMSFPPPTSAEASHASHPTT